MNKKLETFLNFLFGACIIGVPVVFGISDTKTGIVKTKTDKKVDFDSLDDKTGGLKTIQFQDGYRSMEYYNNIKVGDTLKMRTLGKGPVYKNLGLFNSVRIKEINGKTLEEVKALKVGNVANINQLRQAKQKVR